MQAGTSARPPKIGLVMTGGGARAAYQVGVLRAIAQLVPPDAPSPFRIICGTSAGAINAAALACDATHFRRGVQRLLGVWKNFHAGHVYRSDVWGIARCGAHWLTALALGGLGKQNPVSLLDNSPLGDLLSMRLDLAGIQRSIDSGALEALAITASGYTSGQSISFFQGAQALDGWRRTRRIGVRTSIDIGHLMASAAIPFIFPPVRIHREFFGDGSMRQIAPISPAIHLGADRLMVVTVASTGEPEPERVTTVGCPSLAQIAGHALNSIFLDTLRVDLERLDRINHTVEHIPLGARGAGGVTLKRLDYVVLSPSQPLEKIALRHLHALPRPIRFFLRGIGAMRRSGSTLASYLLFERPYCRALLKLGYEDTMARREEILAFLGPAAAGGAAETVGASGRDADVGRPQLRLAV